MKEQTRLKICGITTLEDARYLAGAMVDYLGFIFYPGSPRNISARDAAEICGWIEGPEKTGVFVNQSAEEINRIIERVGLDLVQLHGDESPDIAGKIPLPVIKTFRLGGKESVAGISEKMTEWRDAADYVLLDTLDKKAYGGTGKQWDWSLISELYPGAPLFLAGGITVENVAEAISTVRPFAVDISSSVEMSPGIKDFDKVQTFLDHWNELQETDY